MSLKELSGKKINIADLSPVEERVKSGAEKHFEALKSTVLYDEGLRQWKEYMREGEASDIMRTSMDQLLGVLVTGLFNKKEAESEFEALKHTVLYDRGQWRADMYTRGQRENNPIPYSYNQLLGVLVQGIFDKEAAFVQFQALKKTPGYDERLKQWNPYVAANSNHTRYSPNQLLGILVEGMFDMHEAEVQFEALKRTALYDRDRKHWRRYMFEDQSQCGPEEDGLSSITELLGILVEGLFDKVEALAQFEALKKTSLYDEKLGQWPVGKQFRSSDQLLGILIEDMLEKKDFSPGKGEPVPEERNF